MIDSIAMREAVINAIVHNDYSYGAVPKVEFFSDRAEVTSMGGLPYGVEENDFFSGGSVPRNKEIMRVFRDLEIVEHLGSGILRIVKAYGREAFEIRKSFVRVVLPYAKPIDGVTPQVTPQVLRMLQCMKGEVSRAEMMAALNLKDRMHFSRDYIAPALEIELIEMSIPDKPNSQLQKYRLTDKGREVLKKESRHE